MLESGEEGLVSCIPGFTVSRLAYVDAIFRGIQKERPGPGSHGCSIFRCMNGDRWTVRVSTLADAPAVQQLLEVSYPRLMASAYDEADLLPALHEMTRANPALLDSGRYYVAETVDGKIVGCGGWSHERPGTNEVESGLAHIRHFGTHPDWTKQGVGRAIYRSCEDAARAAGVGAIECHASLNAEDFYGSLGFERIRYMRIELECGRTFRVVLMRRQFW